MSHNVTIKGVVIRDIDAVRQAVSELSQELGIEIQLLENEKIRDYNSHYNRGGEETADYVVRIPSCKYDIGLLKQDDGTYAIRHESMASYDFGQVIGSESGAQTVDGKACNVGSSNMGRLLQRTNVIVAEKEAAQMGHVTSRNYDEATKIMNLEVLV